MCGVSLSLFAQVIVWRLLQDHVPLSVDLQWALSCLCLALQKPCVWNKLSTPEYTTHTCSLIYCLRLIMVAGKEARRTYLYISYDLMWLHAILIKKQNKSIVC